MSGEKILRKTMRELGGEHVASMATKFGLNRTIESIYSYIIGECNGLAVLDGDQKTADFLYKLADHFAVNGISAEELERIGEHIKESAKRGGAA